MSLNTLIAKLPRLQPQVAKKFALLDLHTLWDCLFYFPFRHEDWRQQVQISDIVVGQDVTIAASIVSVKSRPAWHRRGTTITDVVVTDESNAKLHVVWFNMLYLGKSLQSGDQLYLSGTISQTKDGRLQLSNPVYEKPSENPLHEKLVPVYRSTEGLSQRQIRMVMKQAVALANVVPDPFDGSTVQQLELMTLSEALSAIHFPDSPEQAAQAVERLKFDELLAWHLHMTAANSTVAATAPVIPFHEQDIRTFVQHLPYTLTNDQRVAAWQVLQDIALPQPMSRLVQGDVGSGKTVVAALVAYNATLSHYQVAVVAPTVVLAEQHWKTFIATLGKHETKIALLTGHEAKIYSAGTEATVSREDLESAITSGIVSVVIGTHAVLQPDITFYKLGLVIVDEQQRFGVDQRQVLLSGRTDTPHFLSLTATPIPRSFALWLSGILNISTIATKPAGRVVIQSFVAGPDDRQRIDTAINTTLQKKEQIYVITPLIEESDSLGVRAATTEHQRLSEALPHVRVGILHGAMPADERVAILDEFRRHDLDIIVSTTVIEVGVDVPNATLIIIEGAERFGLAQLHQLRGRVGRSSKPSQCYFVTDRRDDAIRKRLEHVAATSDGFTISELDFSERGGGDMYGQRQSGLPAWQLASINDRQLFERVREFSSTLSAEQQNNLLAIVGRHEKTLTPFHPE